MKKEIYLDNAATTKVDPKVVEAMLPYFSDKYGNASSQHTLGKEAKLALEESRKIIAESINAQAEEIYFTSGGTESNNWAIKEIYFANQKNDVPKHNLKGTRFLDAPKLESGSENFGHQNKKKVITSKIEHDSILENTKFLEKMGVKVVYLNVDKSGFVDISQLKKEIDESTLLVSIIHGNNEIGVIQDIGEIGKICREKGVYFHTDACQSYTKTEINVVKQNIDLMTLNAHKIHGPKGIGALYIRKGVKIVPMMHGGGHEKGFRSGTENIPAIVGFAKAVQVSSKKDIEKISVLRDKLIKEILKIKGASLNGSRENRLCNNINISFGDVEGEAIGSYLDAYGIFISTGSACASNKLEKSHVLKAIGASDFKINSSIRISLSKYTSSSEIKEFISKLKLVIEKLRKISPFAK